MRAGLFAAVIALYGGAASAQEICRAPLESALMTVKSNDRRTSESEAATAWQCSFKFSTHNQAIQAGLDVGTVVYGVPLQIGGTFNKAQADQWKEQNCSKSAQSASFEEATYRYLREVAPGAMGAYVSCIATLNNQGALACTLTREPAALTVKWRRSDGELPTAAPRIERILVSNGRCDPNLAAGTAINEGGVGTTCVSDQQKDLMVMVQTNRGLCTAIAAYPKKVYTFAGEVSLDSDRQISTDVVRFAPNARVITNGRALSIVANEVDVDSKAEIVAFHGKDPSRPLGDAGDAGGAVVIKVRSISGGDLRIDLTGQPGMEGVAGQPGAQGAAGRNAKGRGLQGIRGCGGGHASTAGGSGYPGTDGKPGGAGGNGGAVVIQVERGSDLSRVSVVGSNGKTFGGAGGRGGKGGIGGPGGPGGSGDGGHDGCGGRPGSPPGAKGPDGQEGEDGKAGNPGTITMQGG